MISGALRGRGGVHQSMKQFDAAIEDYRVALAFNPEDDEVREAWVTCALQTNRLAEALREEQTLVQRNPSNARLYALGYLFLKLGKWDEAKVALQQAYDKTPSNNENLRFEIMNYLLKANAKRN